MLHATPRRPSIWGYIDLGKSQQLADAEIARRIDAWRALGADGIFFDEAGRDFGVTPARRAAAIGAVHERHLFAFMNAFDPDDLFDAVPARVPRGAALGRGDALLLESFAVREGVRQPAAASDPRVKRALAWRERTGVSIYATTTPSSGYDADAFAFAWRQAAALKLEGIGWGEPQFSSDSRLPWRERPAEERAGKD